MSNWDHHLANDGVRRFENVLQHGALIVFEPQTPTRVQYRLNSWRCATRSSSSALAAGQKKPVRGRETNSRVGNLHQSGFGPDRPGHDGNEKRHRGRRRDEPNLHRVCTKSATNELTPSATIMTKKFRSAETDATAAGRRS